MSGALVTCPMEGMTGTMTGLGSVPLSSRGVLYGHALYIFFVSCPSAKWKPPQNVNRVKSILLLKTKTIPFPFDR